MRLSKWLIALSILSASAANCNAETFALKTNLIGWATTTLNVGAEMAVSPRSTVQIFAALNPWNFSGDKHVKFWSIEPE